MELHNRIAVACWLALAVAGVTAGCAGSALGEGIVLARKDLQVAIPEQQFDSWVFQTAQNEQGCRKRLDAQLGVLLAEAVRNHQLTEAQQNKLRLAGRGDVKRFFDQVEQRRIRFRELQGDRQNVSEVFKDVQPLQQKLNNGLFEEDSLFRKVLNQSLTDSQRSSFDAEFSARLERQNQASVKMALVELEQLIPLTHKQRQTLTKLLAQQAHPISTLSSYTKYLMHYRMSRIDPAQLEGTLDQAQLAAFAKYAKQGEAYAAFLRQQGLLSDEDGEAHE